MKLSDNQQLIVDIKNKDILVSAAAGSGKTATMVEAVIDRIMDKSEPVDVDDLLMVTFSNLAADQMKEKIRKRLEELLEQEPGNAHLARQMVLVNRADICTIDKFCKKLVSKFYDKLDIDANFGIADNGMIFVMQNEILDKLFEKKYIELVSETKKKSEYADFGYLRNFFCKDNADDDELKRMVTKLYYTAMKQVNPIRWLKQAIASTNVKTKEKLNRQSYIQKLLEHQRQINRGFIDEIWYLMPTDDGYDLSAFEDVLKLDIRKIESISNATTYEDMYNAQKARWATFSAKKVIGTGIPDNIVNNFAEARDKFKENYKKSFALVSTVDEIIEQYKDFRRYYIPLILLTIEFMDEYWRLKKKRRLYEFHDISHMAYSLVCTQKPNGEVIPTELAGEIAKSYRYIFIDEYQDGDYIQEGLLCSISGYGKSIPNMFMVGDVKQSIYGFRNARPEIFLGKYDAYEEAKTGSVPSNEQVKVLLNQNYRSRREVLDATNFFFWQLMDKNLGGLDYGKDTMLVEGCTIPDSPSDVRAEILVARNYEDDGNERVVSDYAKEELETALIVRRITELLDRDNPFYVLRDKYQDILKEKLQENPDITEDEKKALIYRPAVPGDIAILLRTTKNIGDKLRDALAAKGIPVALENAKGYYEAVELRIMMSYLEIIDNSLQDIPLAAVLISPIAKLTEDEMAVIVKYGESFLDMSIGKPTLYDKCLAFVVNREQIKQDRTGLVESAFAKLECFIGKLNEYKELAKQLTVGELVCKLIEDSGYAEYVSAMPGGKRRRANLEKLISIANDFEADSYKGLFKFVQYIKRIKLSKIDVGEAQSDEDTESVKILTMHKSKGLEYPIVFVSELGKKLSSGKSDILEMSSEYFISGKAINESERCRYDAEHNVAVKTLLDANSFAEEMRILYVAMTRAKEKLFLTGCETADYVEKLESIEERQNWDSLRLPYYVRCSDAGFMFWIENCYSRYEQLIKGGDYGPDVTDETGKLVIRDASSYLLRTEVGYKELEKYIQFTAAAQSFDFDMLVYDAVNHNASKYDELIAKEMGYRYRYEPFTDMKTKYSISEIKGLMAYDVDDDIEDDIEDKELDIIPHSEDKPFEKRERIHKTEDKAEADVQEADIVIAPNERGTIVHKLMELLPFNELPCGAETVVYEAAVKSAIRQLVAEEVFDEEQAAVIPVYNITLFLESDLGQRMIAASKRRELFREKSFTISFDALELSSVLYEDVYDAEALRIIDSGIDDRIIVQGTIDAYFYEGDKAVLVDYKTDRLSPESLMAAYHGQLEYYARTIEQLLDRNVEERLIYSFHNNCKVEVN